jgi:hypothetical protein
VSEITGRKACALAAPGFYTFSSRIREVLKINALERGLHRQFRGGGGEVQLSVTAQKQNLLAATISCNFPSEGSRGRVTIFGV